jgi:HlyD family secretion protein
MLNRRNGLLVLVLVGLAVAAGLWYRQQLLATQAANQAALRQETIGRGTIIATVNATGYLAPRSEVNLYFGTTSPQPVVALDAGLGEPVAAGQVLARLDDRELLMAVREAEQALQAAELRLALLKAPPRPEDVAVAEANLAVARNQVYAASQGQSAEAVEIARLNLVMAQNALNATYDQMDRLVEQGRWAEKNALQATADRQVEEARIADLRYHQAQDDPAYGPIASAQAGVEQAQAALLRLQRGPTDEDVGIAELEVSQAQAALESARYNLTGAQLVAPFDGVVAAVNLNVGEAASSVTPAVVLADIGQFYLDVSVDEVDVARVQAAQAVTVTLDALPSEALAAVVERIAPSATVNQGVVSYAVRLTLDPGEAALRGGMTATAAIVVDEARDVLVVPNWAVRRDRETGAFFASLLRGGQVVEVPVELGLRDEAVSQVLSGVQAGDLAAVQVARQVFSLFGGGG